VPLADDVFIISLDEKERWDAEYTEGGLPSQSWNYAWGLSASGFNPQLAVVKSKGARMLLPFFERSYMGTTDIATVPGLSGASIVPSTSAPLALWAEFATSRGWIAGYIQLAAGITLDSAPPKSHLASHNSMFVFDLQEWDIYQSISRKFRKQHLYEGRRRSAILVDDRARLAERLRSLYPEYLQRIGLPQGFSDESIQRWIADPSGFALGAQMGETLEAIHLGRVNRTNAEWHIAAVSEHGRSLGAWIVWNAMERLKKMGVRYFNIGGGIRANDGLHDYKSRFGAIEMPLLSVRQIYDPRRYDELCAQSGIPSSGNWFPAYRGPGGSE
jgi:hypothetical protein